MFMYFFVWHGDMAIHYYKNKQEGMYNTQKEFGYHREGETSWLVSLSDRFFYRDYETDGIRELASPYEASSDKVGAAGIYTNSKFVYIERNNKVIQYSEEGEQISVKEFAINDYIKNIYCGEKYVYALTVNKTKEEDYKYRLWIMDADQVERTMDIGEVKEKITTGAFIGIDDGFIEHKAFETSEIILYYCGEIERKDTAKGSVYQINENDAESEFEPVMINKSSGNRVFSSNIELTTENLLAMYDEQLYSWDDGMVEFAPEFLKVYLTDSEGNTEVIYESEKYKPICARVVGETLIILGEDFYKIPMEEGGSPYLTGDYRGAVLVYYDMNNQEIIQEYTFENEQIIYMNVNDYATLKDGKVRYYEINSGKLFWEKEIQGYEAGDSEDINWYYFEECGGRLFMFRENDGKLICVFTMNKTGSFDTAA